LMDGILLVPGPGDDGRHVADGDAEDAFPVETGTEDIAGTGRERCLGAGLREVARVVVAARRKEGVDGRVDDDLEGARRTGSASELGTELGNEVGGDGGGSDHTSGVMSA
jgi:hypothetical protein